MKSQYLPTVSAIASGGYYDTFDSTRNVQTGGWWAAGGLVSMPIFTGGLIENQVKEAGAQEAAANAQSLNIEQAIPTARMRTAPRTAWAGRGTR